MTQHMVHSGLPPWVERWLPIKRLSDEEWEEHERKKKSDFKARWVPLASAFINSCLWNLTVQPCAFFQLIFRVAVTRRIDATLEGGLSAAVSKQREEAAGRSQGRSREQ